jgi:hypothetical protein
VTDTQQSTGAAKAAQPQQQPQQQAQQQQQQQQQQPMDAAAAAMLHAAQMRGIKGAPRSSLPPPQPIPQQQQVMPVPQSNVTNETERLFPSLENFIS